MSTALPLDRLFTGFLLAKEADGLRDSTLDMYRLMWSGLVSYLSTEQLQDAHAIESTHLRGWIVKMTERLAPATRDQRIAKCKAFFHWCHAEGFLPTDPAAYLKRPTDDWQPDPLSPEEVQALLAESKRGRNATRNHAIVCFLLDSGLRNTELRSLTLADVNLKSGHVDVKEGKGGKARIAVIGKRAKEALWRWVMVRPEGACDFLFVTERGLPFSRMALSKVMLNLGKRCGFRTNPHRLRHTFAVLYLKGGGDPYSLQRLLGHTDMTVTRMYVKLAAADVAELYRSPLDALSL